MSEFESKLDLLLEKAAVRRSRPSPAEARAIREAAGLRGEELAEVLGVTRQTISNWEAAARKPNENAMAERYYELLERLRQFNNENGSA